MIDLSMIMILRESLGLLLVAFLNTTREEIITWSLKLGEGLRG